LCDQAAHRNTGEVVKQRKHRFENRAADILEIDVDAFWAGFLEFGAKVRIAVIDAVVEAEFLPVSAEAGVLANSLALRIVRQSTIDYVAFAEPSTRPEPSPGPRSGQGRAATWRTVNIETDARVLFCRERDGRLGDVFLLDGSRVRANVNPPLEFDTPHRIEQVHLNGDPERVAPRTSVEL
jgi:hypothetical protein